MVFYLSGYWVNKRYCICAMFWRKQDFLKGEVGVRSDICNLALLRTIVYNRVLVLISSFLPQNLPLRSVCLAVWVAIRRLAVPLGWLHHFTLYPLRSQWQPQPRETWVMVLSDVHPDSIELDGRHTPKITKAGERQRGDWVGEMEGRSQAIDKAGTHCLIKIYFFFSPSPFASAGQRGGGENVISGLLLPGCLW